MKHKPNERERQDEMTQHVMDWGDLSIGNHFIEDTFNEIYKVVETGLYDPAAWVGKKGEKPPQRFGVKAVVVGIRLARPLRIGSPKSQRFSTMTSIMVSLFTG